MDFADNFCPTPPMGWNSWYCFSESVSDINIRRVAVAMKESGLSEHGWSFINIDDCWQGLRGGEFNAIQGNERFPDMKALADFIHDQGLKFGLYSTPWISSYAGFRGGSEEGNIEQERALPIAERLQLHQLYGRCPSGRDLEVFQTGRKWLFSNDAKQWAQWGVDFVKVDWLPNDVPTTQKIKKDLIDSGRNIILSLSNDSPIENARELSQLANLWRISGDIKDTWESICHNGLDCAKAWLKHAQKGHYIDPDMLMIGDIGLPNKKNIAYKKSNLTFNEQKFQFALWSMLSAPLILSCDIEGMDQNTFEILTNDDIISINQDALGLMPTIEELIPGVLGYQKLLSDGNTALGIFNISDSEKHIDCGRFFDNMDYVKDLYSKSLPTSSYITIKPHSPKLYKLFQ